jgi:gamma-glutamylcyclotransferase (GGCT)/AIG2-like uncharacterized protein YtfP
MNLFAYGTLMFPEVMRAVTGREFASLAAELHGFSRYRVKDRTFPGIVIDPNGSIQGILYPGIGEVTLQQIDDFEDDFYLRQPVTVITVHGTKMNAQTYVVPEQQSDLLTSEPWDPDSFMQKDLPRFLSQRNPGST